MTASKIDVVRSALRTAEEELVSPSNDGTPKAISLRTGVAQANVLKNLRKLRADDQAHILCWTEGNPRSPVWVSGPGEDAPKPAPFTKAELRQRHADSQRKRRQGVKVEIVPGMARQMTYDCIERARSVPQSWWSALEAA